jgi:hypothetical protein
MPATRHTFGKCGHKGFGAECHRCQEAVRLEAIGNDKAKAAPIGKQRKTEAFKGWKKADFLAEAKRLALPREKRNVYTPTVIPD